ncbi:MAG TPA: hypothetical protein VMU33_01515 [Burkholderiaceae bacterium]|nr:hypothetical protein [Burkholderiaceae bacterium]
MAIRAVAATVAGVAIVLTLTSVAAYGDDAKPPQNAARIDIRTPGGHAASLTPEDLARLPRLAVHTTDRGGAPSTYEGPKLVDALAQAGVAVGAKAHGQDFARVVVVMGSDGYKAVFSLAELDDSFTDHAVILADRKDGSTLDAKDGMYRLIVGEDKRPTRWVRGVTSIDVLAP